MSSVLSCRHDPVIQERGYRRYLQREEDTGSSTHLPTIIVEDCHPQLDQLDSVIALHELQIPPGNRLEALKGDRQGQQSIRINDQYRICFRWTDTGPAEVEIVDYH